MRCSGSEGEKPIRMRLNGEKLEQGKRFVTLEVNRFEERRDEVV